MLIVFNPTAGRRRVHLLWRVLDIVMASGVRVELVETTRPGHAALLARSAAERGVPMIVAAGGDGTVAEVASGLTGSGAKLGIIPLGTANVLARELALPFAPRAVAAALAFGRTMPLWPGVATGPDGARLFVQMLGVGFDAQVVHGLSRPLKRVLGRGAYVLQTLREMSRYTFRPIRVRIDGGEETSASSVILTKGRLYGGNYQLAPEARPNEPGFSVVLFDRPGARGALYYGAALPLDLLPRAAGIRRIRASHIEIGGNTGIPAQADGDAAGFSPLVVTDATAPISIVVEQR